MLHNNRTTSLSLSYIGFVQSMEIALSASGVHLPQKLIIQIAREGKERKLDKNMTRNF
jgi:hypothetical protein